MQAAASPPTRAATPVSTFGSVGRSGEDAHAVQAGGNIDCRLPAGANATLNLQYGGSLHIGNQHTRQSEGGHLARLVLGTGEIVMTLMAGGDIRSHGRRDPRAATWTTSLIRWNEACATSPAAWKSQLAAMASQLDTHLGELGYADAIAARVQEKIQRAMSRAEAKIEKAMRQAERQAEKTGATTGAPRTASRSQGAARSPDMDRRVHSASAASQRRRTCRRSAYARGGQNLGRTGGDVALRYGSVGE